jgi:hypothetical protein
MAKPDVFVDEFTVTVRTPMAHDGAHVGEVGRVDRSTKAIERATDAAHDSNE